MKKGQWSSIYFIRIQMNSQWSFREFNKGQETSNVQDNGYYFYYYLYVTIDPVSNIFIAAIM